MKAIILVVIGMAMGMSVMAGVMYEAPVKEKDSQVILGHRVTQLGQEMIIYK